MGDKGPSPVRFVDDRRVKKTTLELDKKKWIQKKLYNGVCKRLK